MSLNLPPSRFSNNNFPTNHITENTFPPQPTQTPDFLEIIRQIEVRLLAAMDTKLKASLQQQPHVQQYDTMFPPLQHQQHNLKPAIPNNLHFFSPPNQPSPRNPFHPTNNNNFNNSFNNNYPNNTNNNNFSQTNPIQFQH